VVRSKYDAIAFCHDEEQNLNFTLTPPTVLIDFEIALRQSVQLQFPVASIKGCYFHFTQCLYRWIQTHVDEVNQLVEVGMGSAYKSVDTVVPSLKSVVVSVVPHNNRKVSQPCLLKVCGELLNGRHQLVNCLDFKH
jgi:hypothetical protein